jgi:nitrogen-specific signal transduction histidine kinase
LLDGLLDYFQVATLTQKTNTVNTLIEEALKRNQIQLTEKGLKLFKKLETDLPEIIVPDEHLEYIFNSVLQYVIASIPTYGNIELSTKFSIFKKGAGEELACFEEYGGTIEIVIVCGGDREPADDSVTAMGPIPTVQKDGASELILRLVKEMVMKNRGIMKFESDEKAKTMISLIFPIERRKVAYYESMSISPPANHLNILEF